MSKKKSTAATSKSKITAFNMVGKISAVVVAAAVAFAINSFGGPSVLWYRVATSWKAFQAIYTLPQETVDNFLKSYELFDQEKVTKSDADETNIVRYYQVLNHLCAIGEVEKMYIPPCVDKKLSIFGNQMKWEESGMADKLDIGPGKKVLEVGCGRGRIAHHVASYTGAHVTGLNIDTTQIGLAEQYAKATNMENNLTFVYGNYNKGLPFPNNTFDALYHVQALTYAEDFAFLFGEMYRVLKPGAKISFLDWFKLPAFNPEDKQHQLVLKEVKAVIGAVYTPSPEEYDVALMKAGFEVLTSGEASTDGGHQYPLVESADFFFRSVKSLVGFLVQLKLLPAHLKTLLDRLTEGGLSFVEADKLGLFTTSWQIVARKKA